MPAQYSVSLAKTIREQGLESLYMPRDPGELYITSKEVNRPGLLFAGYDGYFNPDRPQFIGLAEKGYFDSVTDEERDAKINHFMSKKPCVVIITRGLEPIGNLLEKAREYGVPLLRTQNSTSDAMASMISFLGVQLAERITRHGVLVEVAGEGVLILGSSGVGKSETAVELVKRGHRLIADDAVEIRKVSAKSLVGSAPENIRHFVELRGVGIVNVIRTFGTAAVKMTEKIDMVIQLEPWDPSAVYDRLGLDEDFVDIMGVRVPATIVPVKPGRNLAIIIEVAAVSNRQKRMGYNAAQELMGNLGMGDFQPDARELDIWKG
ncbi:MAG: HPr(Ser) kinase/phosphatase [Clostridia bacterium]|nr:HPr(Ser) kinase/phosphatase [Clostridia bacterium]